METQPSDFSRALALHRQGRFAEAIPLYEAFLRTNRRHVGAANLLGVALLQNGRLMEAAAAIQKALRLDPKQASAHYNLGTVLQQLGRHEEAVSHFSAAIALRPEDAQSHNNLGAALKALGRLEEAAAAYRKAAAIQPGFAEAHANLAAALCGLERYEEAVQAGQRALGLNPNLAEVCVTIGNALHEMGKKKEALQFYDRALALQPDSPVTYFCAGNVLMGLQQENRAAEYFRKAADLNPKSASTRFRLAHCLNTLKLFDEASREAKKAFADMTDSADDELSAGMYLMKINQAEQALPHLEKALSLDPKSLPAQQGYAGAVMLLQRPKEAMKVYDRIIERRFVSDDIKVDKAIAALSVGDFQQGWELFEVRLSEELGLIPPRRHSAPRWRGEDIPGSLLIWGEQGLGDQIIYGSVVADASRRAKKIVLDVDPRLVPLFGRSFPEAEVRPLQAESNEKDIAAQIPIGSLCSLLRPDWESFPRRAYLIADRERAENLRIRLHAGSKLAIGISWRSANNKVGEHKTARVQDFSGILRLPDTLAVDLQYGETAGELKAVREETGVAVAHLDEIDNTNDIDGLAALIEACDAVVTVSNTTAHLAGALGKPVWILVPHGQGRIWYWFRDRTDSPWYPGARIVRQQPGQPWADVVASIAPEISEFARGLKKGVDGPGQAQP